VLSRFPNLLVFVANSDNAVTSFTAANTKRVTVVLAVQPKTHKHIIATAQVLAATHPHIAFVVVQRDDATKVRTIFNSLL
jgi:hypothetical protein